MNGVRPVPATYWARWQRNKRASKTWVDLLTRKDETDTDLRKRILVDLWMKQSELFWKVTFATPLIEIAVLTAWYNVWKTCNLSLSQVALAMGIFIMGVQMLILWRHAQYLNTFRQAADSLIPRVPRALLGLTGYRLGVAIPFMICVVHIGMLVALPVPKSCEVALSPLPSTVKLMPMKQQSTPTIKPN